MLNLLCKILRIEQHSFFDNHFLPNYFIMSDKQYDSVLVGYAEEPRYNEEGQLSAGASDSRTPSSKR